MTNKKKNSRFDLEGGWCDYYGNITEKVQENSSNNYTIELAKKKITVFINAGFVYTSAYREVTGLCNFLGIQKYLFPGYGKSVISMIKIKTGWFSSIQVSHDALVCLDDLNIPLNSKSDWKEAIKKKNQVIKHYQILKKKELDKKKESRRKAKEKKAKKDAERLREIESKKRKREEEKKKKEEEKKKKEKARKINLLEEYGDNDGKKIFKKKIWVGMTKKMLIDSRGRPRDIEETVYKNTTKQYCFYKKYTTIQKNTRYKFRVDLENDIVVGWKDLD
jgi:hypothetical protein